MSGAKEPKPRRAVRKHLPSEEELILQPLREVMDPTPPGAYKKGKPGYDEDVGEYAWRKDSTVTSSNKLLKGRRPYTRRKIGHGHWPNEKRSAGGSKTVVSREEMMG